MTTFRSFPSSVFSRSLLLGGLLFGIGMFDSGSVHASVYPARYKIPADVTQLAVVKYKGRSKGIFTFYQRHADKPWKKVFSCGAWLGKNGIGKKKEGDKKTPMGLYGLEQPFGILKNPGMDKNWHYLKVTKNHYWCDTSKGRYSKYYNHLITSKKHVPGEHLIDHKSIYDYSMFITYNKQGKLNKGSCIFLHCSLNRATAGCVAIPKKYLIKFMKKIKPEQHPSILIYQ